MSNRFDSASAAVAAYAEMRRASEYLESVMMGAHGAAARLLEMQDSLARFAASHAGIVSQIEAFRASLIDPLVASSRMIDQFQSQLSAGAVASPTVALSC